MSSVVVCLFVDGYLAPASMLKYGSKAHVQGNQRAIGEWRTAQRRPSPQIRSEMR